jgi:hypothetical protein
MSSFSCPWSWELSRALLLLEILDGIDCVISEEYNGPAINLWEAYRLHPLEQTLEPLLRQTLCQLSDQLICGSMDILVLFGGAAGPYQGNHLLWECLCVLC